MADRTWRKDLQRAAGRLVDLLARKGDKQVPDFILLMQFVIVNKVARSYFGDEEVDEEIRKNKEMWESIINDPQLDSEEFSTMEEAEAELHEGIERAGGQDGERKE